MNGLHMAIYTGADEGNKVTLTASFGTHEETVSFHQDLAALCNKHSQGAMLERGVVKGWLSLAKPRE